MSMFETKMRLLVHEARRWVGITEQGGDNRGQCVELFQKAVDGKAQGEPWCVGFTFFCLKQVDVVFDVFADVCMPRTTLYPTEHVLTLWDKSPREQRISEPMPGALMLWQMYTDGKATTSGHVGIVTATGGESFVYTIEGNTNGGDGIVREGNGVFERKRSPSGSAEMRVLGYICPWQLNGDGI